MINKIQTYIEKEQSNRNTIFIYPSEIAADWGRKKALERQKAIEWNRFISWDTFKEEFLSVKREDLRPVSKTDKLFFYFSIAEENRKHPFLKAIIPPEFHKQSASMVSSLEEAMNSLFLLEPNFANLGNEGVRGDLGLLKERFSRFKERYHLFEADVLESAVITGVKHYYLFYPELILDFDEYRHLVVSQERVTLVSGPSSVGEDFNFFYYSDAKEEVKSLLSEVRSLLERSVELLITVADNSLLPLLSYYAPLYGVPLDFRQGKKLGDFNEIKFFSKMQENLSNQFQFQSFKSFLLNGSPLWKESDQQNNQLLLRAASKGFCLVGEEHWKRAIWGLGGLSREEKDGVKLHFKQLVGAMRKIVTAPSLLELKGAIQIFINQHLDLEKLKGNSRRRFESALDKLNELVAKEEIFVDLAYGSPYALWLQTLSKSLYVAKSQIQGVPVYDYRVSAGCFPQYHFICGVTQNSCNVVVEQAPLVSNPEKEIWLAQKRGEDKKVELSKDFTLPFLNCYTVSGSHVKISGSMESLGQPQVAPAQWMVENRVFEVTEREVDPVLREFGEISASKVTKSGNSLSPLSSYLDGGRERFLQRGEVSYLNYTQQPVLEDILALALQKVRQKGGKMRFSASFLENRRKCAWRALSADLLGDPLEKKSAVTDGAFEGSLLHEILDRFYKKILEVHLPYNVENREVFEGWLVQTQRELFQEMEDKFAVRPVEPQWKALKAKLFYQVLQQFRDEFSLYPDGWVVGCEDSFLLEEGDFSLYGRIDKVLRRGKSFIIIDYKRKLRVTKREILPKESSITPSSFQMPLYALLLEEKAKEGDIELLYYDLKEGRFKSVYEEDEDKKSWFTKEEVELTQLYLKEFAQRTATSITRGDYTIGSEPQCNYCVYSSFCRKHYAITPTIEGSSIIYDENSERSE